LRLVELNWGEQGFTESELSKDEARSVLAVQS
jgi:hypothetical protein